MVMYNFLDSLFDRFIIYFSIVSWKVYIVLYIRCMFELCVCPFNFEEKQQQQQHATVPHRPRNWSEEVPFL